MKLSAEFALRWRVRLGYPAALIYLWFARPLEKWIFIGGAIAVGGLLVRAAAAGHLRKHERLATSGPYAFTRNPLYFGSALIALGFLVAGRCWTGHGWVGAIVVAGYFGCFYPMVMNEEERELRVRYGQSFEEYASRVPLFFPRLTNGYRGQNGFSWEHYLRNREYQAALGVLAGLLVLGLLTFVQGA